MNIADRNTINKRLLKLKSQRSQILGLKKSERGNQLVEINSIIKRLKTWIK